MRTPLVSIVMPLYNAAPHVAQAVASVTAQTLPDWELLVVDDGSTDGGDTEVARRAAADDRIVPLRHPRNLGAAAARNTATGQARGRWIAFLDADDAWDPEKLARTVAFAEASGHAFVHHWYRRIEADGTPRPGEVTAPPVLTYADLLRANRIGCLTAMYDADRIGKVYAPDIAARNDYATWLGVLRRTGTAHCLPEVLASYRLSPGSISRNKLGLIAHHYHLFRNVEGLSLPASAFYVSCNILSKLARG
jgi:glycosyltransferase involved in cell wall biosynthesis